MTSNNQNEYRFDSGNLLRILNNIDRMTTIYNTYIELTDEQIDIIKNTIIKLNNQEFSYYYLMKKDFYYINKYNIKMRINFKVKITNGNLLYLIKINLLTGETLCNLYKCSDVFCTNGKHYYQKNHDDKYTYENEDVNELLKDFENKINDFKTCENCDKIWDMDKDDRNCQGNNYENCDNCNFFIHLNKKTMKPVDKCSICLKDMYLNEIKKTSCNHNFHNKCLNIWTREHNTCPICRSNLE